MYYGGLKERISLFPELSPEVLDILRGEVRYLSVPEVEDGQTTRIFGVVPILTEVIYHGGTKIGGWEVRVFGYDEYGGRERGRFVVESNGKVRGFKGYTRAKHFVDSLGQLDQVNQLEVFAEANERLREFLVDKLEKGELFSMEDLFESLKEFPPAVVDLVLSDSISRIHDIEPFPRKIDDKLLEGIGLNYLFLLPIFYREGYYDELIETSKERIDSLGGKFPAARLALLDLLRGGLVT